MAWPYEFLDLTPEARASRHESMVRHAAIAHYSSLLPIAVFLIINLARRVLRLIPGLAKPSGADSHGTYQEVPGSPSTKAQRLALPGGIGGGWRAFKWWMGDDLFLGSMHLGHRDQWVLGAVWTAWLLGLCIYGTGRDYLHLTKNLGVIAASQLPIQYLMALNYANPLSLAFRSSHEEINRYHRALGRIVYCLVVAHVVLYNVFLLYKSIWLKRFFAPVVFCGVVASLGFHALNGTALARVRKLSYRLFFVTHIVVASLVPLLIFFHARLVRWYVVEALAVFIVDLVARKLVAVTSPSALEIIPGTNLIKISAPLPPNKAAAFRAQPGSHIYINLPSAARSNAVPSSKSYLFDVLYNPFSVASVSEDGNTITFVARARGGPVTNVLSQYASRPTISNKIPISIEGPYGALSKQFQQLLGWTSGRILIFAGGIGATFALPIYQAIVSERPGAKIQLIWAIRGASDATWATNPNDSSSSASTSVLDDEHIQLFLTGDLSVANGSDNASGVVGDAVEMSDLRRDDRRSSLTANHARKRPDIAKIVDDTFRLGREETVAVLVCGPVEMAREVRSSVRPWVMKSRRKVWFHDESFGW